jgi:hypothetical protein
MDDFETLVNKMRPVWQEANEAEQEAMRDCVALAVAIASDGLSAAETLRESLAGIFARMEQMKAYKTN